MTIMVLIFLLEIYIIDWGILESWILVYPCQGFKS